MRIGREEYAELRTNLISAYSRDSSFKKYFDSKYEFVRLLNEQPQTFNDFDCKSPEGRREDGTNILIGTFGTVDSPINVHILLEDNRELIPFYKDLSSILRRPGFQNGKCAPIKKSDFRQDIESEIVELFFSSRTRLSALVNLQDEKIDLLYSPFFGEAIVSDDFLQEYSKKRYAPPKEEINFLLYMDVLEKLGIDSPASELSSVEEILEAEPEPKHKKRKSFLDGFYIPMHP